MPSSPVRWVATIIGQHRAIPQVSALSIETASFSSSPHFGRVSSHLCQIPFVLPWAQGGPQRPDLTKSQGLPQCCQVERVAKLTQLSLKVWRLRLTDLRTDSCVLPLSSLYPARNVLGQDLSPLPSSPNLHASPLQVHPEPVGIPSRSQRLDEEFHLRRE